MTASPPALYLDLLKKTLSFSLWPEPPVPLRLFNYGRPPWKRAIVSEVSSKEREEGRGWPVYADTMIGLRRLENLQHCMETVLRDGVEGDFIETGVWRGGACIFMRGLLAAYGVSDRRVFVADSFQGLPRPNATEYPVDAGDSHHVHEFLAVSEADVRRNFERYDLLDSQVVFLGGWFQDTLPNADIQRLAVLRLDGDMYQSTMDAIRALYPKLSPGGFCIVDDYALVGCRKATDDYRQENRIDAEMVRIDFTAHYWRKPFAPSARRQTDAP